ncbi:hypothetical protein F5146DRAFT_1064922 [Armillaria mellea]|nr:hypothetical protein F5146DRAFT_1064922 [Armillaria mellea]
MSWSIRDPPSPVSMPPLQLEDALRAYSPQPPPPPRMSASSRMWSPQFASLSPSMRAYSPQPPPPPCLPASPRTCSPPLLAPHPPNITLELVGQEQWSTNPLQIKSTFTIIGEPNFQLLSSAACGMGWCFNLDLRPATISTKKKGKTGSHGKSKTDPSVVAVHASLQPGLVGFPPGSYSIHASFRREDCVLALLENDEEDFSFRKQSIPLGRCNVPLPLEGIIIDLAITLSFSDLEPSFKVPRTISAPMSKAIRATLDGEFPVDVKFMLFSHKHGEGFVNNRRLVYASRNILKGRNSFLDSYMDGSRNKDVPFLPGVYQCPYGEDSDLESDSDEDPPCEVPDTRTADISAREPRPNSLSRPLSPVNLDSVHPMPPESPRPKASPVASIFDVNGDSSPSSVIPCQKSPTWSELGMSNHTMSVYDKAPSPKCDVDARFSEADQVVPEEKVSASLPHLALVNDVAFRTFRAFIIYMYTKEVAFIPLKSSGGCSYDIGDACSPKSMYRLAVKANHESLKKHAFDNLCSQLGPKNIITEIFSQFTKDYPEIFEMELKVLLDHFTNPAVRDGWERMIDMVASGRLPHGADVLKKVTRALCT